MDTPRFTDGSGDFQAELQRLEHEIEELRARLAQDVTSPEVGSPAASSSDASPSDASPSDAGSPDAGSSDAGSSDGSSSDEGRREGRVRRLARTSRANSHLIGSRPLRAVSSTDDPAIAEVIASVLPLGAARAKRVESPDDDDGPQAA